MGIVPVAGQAVRPYAKVVAVAASITDIASDGFVVPSRTAASTDQFAFGMRREVETNDPASSCRADKVATAASQRGFLT